MKNQSQLLVYFLLFATFLYSCKKEKSETTSQKIQHTWKISETTNNSYDMNGLSTFTTPGGPNDVVIFNADLTAVSIINGETNNATYQLINDTQIAIDGVNYVIQTLTDTQLVLNSKEDTSGGYVEIIIYLKR